LPLIAASSFSNEGLVTPNSCNSSFIAPIKNFQSPRDSVASFPSESLIFILKLSLPIAFKSAYKSSAVISVLSKSSNNFCQPSSLKSTDSISCN